MPFSVSFLYFFKSSPLSNLSHGKSKSNLPKCPYADTCLSELDIPVKYIGVGESIDDLQKFDADAFVNALFDVEIGRAHV